MWKCEICGREFEAKDQHHFCKTPSDIDKYIEMQDAEKRAVLHKVREVIRVAAPDATEKISWQMPTFWQGENLVHFAVSKKHLGIYPGGEASTAFADRLTAAGIDFDKGTIRFPWNKEIDFELIADITKWRVELTKKRKQK